jgi:hypothetical protein
MNEKLIVKQLQTADGKEQLRKSIAVATEHAAEALPKETVRRLIKFLSQNN